MQNQAISYDLTRPEITEDNSLQIKEGFHLVVKNYLPENISEYVANDCNFNNSTQLKLLTAQIWAVNQLI